jgi:hypothetical protein
MHSSTGYFLRSLCHSAALQIVPDSEVHHFPLESQTTKETKDSGNCIRFFCLKNYKDGTSYLPECTFELFTVESFGLEPPS